MAVNLCLDRQVEQRSLYCCFEFPIRRSCEPYHLLWGIDRAAWKRTKMKVCLAAERGLGAVNLEYSMPLSVPQKPQGKTANRQ